jgi:hypothetical protein
MPQAELGARLVDPETGADERLLLTAMASQSGRLADEAFLAYEAGALAEALGSDTRDELEGLERGDPSEGTETLGDVFSRISLLNALPDGAGRGEILSLLGSSAMRGDLLRATAIELSRGSDPALLGEALERMQALPPESSGRAGLAQVFVHVASEAEPSAEARATFVGLLEETLTGSGDLQSRAAALDLLRQRPNDPGAAEVLERLKQDPQDPLANELRTPGK